MPLSIHKGSMTLGYKRWDFPDQSLGIRLDTANLAYLHDGPVIYPAATPGGISAWSSRQGCTHQTIWARLQSSADIMELVLVTDALRRWDSDTPIHLVMPTVAYARQDRVGVQGESHSLKAFAAIINSLGFERVTVFDNHSDVTGAVFDRVHLIDQATIIGRFDALNARLNPGTPDARPVLCSPDSGASKRVASLAAHYGHSSFIRGDKKRDLATGKLTGFKVYAEPGEIEGRDVVMVDDIADGSGTFVGLAAELRKHNPRRVELYVTHGMFTKGLPMLFEGGIDAVWTTDAYRTDLPTDPAKSGYVPAGLTVLKLEDVFSL